MPTHLFVYGTLRAAFSNPPAMQLRQYSRYVGEGVITGRLYDVGNYPGALYIPGDAGLIHGSVYELTANVNTLLAMLDDYEGISAPPGVTDEYERAFIPVHVSGTLVDCWVYLYNWPVDSLRCIESGDYVRYLHG